MPAVYNYDKEIIPREKEVNMLDILIIGSGPAGISAGIYARRAGMKVAIISSADSALLKADKIENYYGFEDGISGSALYENGIKQAKKLGIKIINAQVLGFRYNGSFDVDTNRGALQSTALIVATGSVRKTPAIDGLADFEGKGVSYCATCDGFFHRGKPLAVIGSGEYALHEAAELSSLADTVTILTNGEPPSFELPIDITNISVNTKEIARIAGETLVSDVIFKSGDKLPVSGIFVAVGIAGSTDFARSIGAVVTDNKLAVDEQMATNIPGLFAAGDCTKGINQVVKAVYQGSVAATSATKFVKAQASL